MSYYKMFSGQEKGYIAFSQCEMPEEPMGDSRFL